MRSPRRGSSEVPRKNNAGSADLSVFVTRPPARRSRALLGRLRQLEDVTALTRAPKLDEIPARFIPRCHHLAEEAVDAASTFFQCCARHRRDLRLRARSQLR